MTVATTVLAALVLLLVGILGGLVNVFAMAFSVDDCGDDDRRWRCRGAQPQITALVGMVVGILVAVALTLAPLFADAPVPGAAEPSSDAVIPPGVGTAALVLAGSLLFPFPFVAWVGSVPLPRRRRRSP